MFKKKKQAKKRISNWPVSIWKGAQTQYSSGQDKFKPQWDSSLQTEYLKLKTPCKMMKKQSKLSYIVAKSIN